MQLEGELPRLRELDRLRSEASKKLKSVEMSAKRNTKVDLQNLRGDDKLIQIAFCLKAHPELRSDRDLTRVLTEDLEVVHLFSTENSERSSRVPVLTACRVMQALVSISEHVFSRASLLCYYRIIRELYSLTAPQWNIGSARAGNSGRATAFMTSECLRAIGGFADALRHTSEFLADTGQLYETFELLKAVRLSPRSHNWVELEAERAGLSWFISSDTRDRARCLLFECVSPASTFDFSCIEEQLGIVDTQVLPKLLEAESEFIVASEQAQSHWDDCEEETYLYPRRQLEEAGHKIALQAIRQAAANAEAAIAICRSGPIREKLRVLSRHFADAASSVDRLTAPSRHFLESVIDRELAAWTSKSLHVDIPELIFAAAAYGAITKEWHQERILRATKYLYKEISESGDFVAGQPYVTTDLGYRMNPVSFEVNRAASQLFGNVDPMLRPKVAKRMLRLYQRHFITGRNGLAGWSFEDSPTPTRISAWATARAFLSLKQYQQMLDQIISTTILAQVQASPGTSLSLDDLLYPDYGLSTAPTSIRPASTLGVAFQRLRAHVLDAALPEKYQEDKFFSVVLFGPPGTGKTTLFEALARTCDLPFVYISPSDIAIGGELEIERRSKALFDAISMLQNAVIVLDEFEPVISRRDGDQAAERNHGIYRFLTASTLPKLNTLNTRAEDQNIAYGLVTNYYKQLDDAAVRRGRFDHHLQVFHSDQMSREGFLAFISAKEQVRPDNGELDPQGVDIQKLLGVTELFANEARQERVRATARSMKYSAAGPASKALKKAIPSILKLDGAPGALEPERKVVRGYKCAKKELDSEDLLKALELQTYYYLLEQEIIEESTGTERALELIKDHLEGVPKTDMCKED